MDARELRRGEAAYPARLAELPNPPAALWVAGQMQRAPTIAIVGTRPPVADAAVFAEELAGAVALAGGIVVSGWAKGIDAAAHRGVIAQGGPTWVVAPTGHEHVYPEDHGELYDTVVRTGGAVLWPFPPGTTALRHNFFLRNSVLVALADLVVVVQAGIPSGALNAAAWARKLRRPLWVVAGAPWMTGFRGCHAELARGGAHLLTSIKAVLRAAGLLLRTNLAPSPSSSDGAHPVGLSRTFSPQEKALLLATGRTPRHVDEIASRAGLPASALGTLLLTLALEDVVVEGPDGFFRRGSSP